MVKLVDSKIKKCQGEAYLRVIGNETLSGILSRVQALIIRSGVDLEHMILERVNKIPNLDEYLSNNNHIGIFVVPKKIIEKSLIVQFNGIEPDFMVFIESEKKKSCHIIELKDGCEFDTKSSMMEKQSISEFIRNNAQKLPYTFDGHICCFNEKTRDSIVKGFKSKITTKDAMTGKEFCDLLEIDYEEIILERMQHRSENLDYFLEVITKDTEISNKLKELLKM